MDKKALKTTVPLILVAILSLLGPLTTQNVSANPASILISPRDGVVGDKLVVYGTIDTLDADFTVRWNQILNFTATAVGDNATISFIIPPTVGAPRPVGRNVTVELIDEDIGSVVAATNFTLFTKFDMRVEPLTPPRQLQEGNRTLIRVNVGGGLPNTIYPANITVKDPANQTHSAVLLLSNTTSTGSGDGTKAYPNDFSGAHTNLTGTYFVSSNVTADVPELPRFFIGLTDKNEYRRNETVQVQVTGYLSYEMAKVDIKIGQASVVGFPNNVTASSSGLIKLSWKVPVNATSGTYRITLVSTTIGGTAKTPSDIQDFEVLGVVCLVQAINRAGEAVEGASIEVYNASATTAALNKGNTNSTGWIRFNLNEGSYTFKAFVRNVQVGLLENEALMVDRELQVQLSLINFLATVKTVESEGVPLIDVALRFSYKTRDNNTVSEKAAAQTNATGNAAISNLFTNKTYGMEARRYGLLFSNMTLTVEPSPTSGWISLNLTLPNHTLNVHAIDSKGSDAFGINIRAYEWTSGIATSVDSAATNSSGSALFSLPFGRYVLRAFKGDDFLSETTVDLDEPTIFTFNLVTLNVNVIVSVLDYFGQPLANAEVKIERKIGQDFVLTSTQLTSASGSAQFAEIVGGDSRVSVYLGSTLVAVKTQFLGAGSSEVAFWVAEYVAVAGYPLSTGTFTLIIFIFVLIAAMLVAARRRIMQMFRKPSKR